MPELPEVETVRRMLEAHVPGRIVRRAWISGAKLRGAVPRTLPRKLAGRRIEGVRRHGKYLLLDLDGGLSLISHLGMSGRWLFYPEPESGSPNRADDSMPHVHARLVFEDSSQLWYQDPRRFGLLRLVTRDRLARDPSLALLGPDPIADPPSGTSLKERARGARVAVKNFLIDQRRIAGVGNIYASEILHRARLDPRRRAGALTLDEWERVARETVAVLGEAIDRFGTTFSAYRTLWNEPGTYGERLFVYDRAAEPCRRCGTPIRRIVQGARSTFFCPQCQPRASASRTTRRPLPPPHAAGRRQRNAKRPARRATRRASIASS